MADPPPVLTLLVQKGPCKGEIRRGRAGAALRVGRVAKGNHLAVRDAGASQSHLSVEFLKPPAARWAVTDLGSSNGTLLNEAPLVPTIPAPLSDGDLIKIGESTVLAVSIAADEGPAPAPSATARSTRNATAAAAVEEEQAPVVTRGAGWKKAVAAAPEAEMEVEEAAAVPTRRGGRRKVTAPPDAEKEVEEAAVPTRRGGRRKAVEPPEVATEEEEEEAVVLPRGGRKKAAEPPDAEKEAKEEAAVPTRRGGRRKAVEPPEVEKEDEEEEAAVPPRGLRKKAKKAAEPPDAEKEAKEEAAVPTRRGGRRKAVEPPEVEKEDEEEEATVPPRGGRKKAAERPDAEKEAKEEAAVPMRRGGRRKAVEPPEVETEEEEEEAAVLPRGGRRKAAATAALPPKAKSTRSTRAAARRGDAVECGNDEVERAGRGRRPTTRASAKKATHAVPEEDEEDEEAPVTRDRVGNPPTATGVKGGEEDALEIETRDGTSNTSEEVAGAGRGHVKSTRGDWRMAPSACERKADDAVIELEDEKEQEESDMADGRGSRGNPQRVMAANGGGGEEDEVATGDDKLDRTSKASIEDEKMVDVEEDVPLAPKERAIEGRVSAQLATANNGSMEEEEGRDLSRGGETEVDHGLRERVLPESKPDSVGEVEERDKREAVSHNGEEGPVEGRPLRNSLENMTLGEWFNRIEKYLLAKNEEAAEKAIAEVQEKHQRFCEHLKTLNKSSDPS